MPDQWVVSFADEAQQDRYKIPRGEAAIFTDAIAVLFDGPEPEGFQSIEGFLNVYEYTRNGYRIVYEVKAQDRPKRNRVILFEKL